MEKIKKINHTCAFILLVNDISVIYLCFIFTYWLRFYALSLPTPFGIPSFRDYIPLALISSLILLISLNHKRLYDINKIAMGFEEKIKIFKAVNTGVLILLAATFFYRAVTYSRIFFVMLWILLVFSLMFTRHLWNHFFIWYRKRPRNQRNLAVVFYNNIDRRLLSMFSRDKSLGYRLKGIIILGDVSRGGDSEKRVYRDVEDLRELLSREDIDEVLISSLEIPRKKMLDIISECERQMVSIKFLADTLSLVTSNLELQNLSDFTLLTLKESPLNYLPNRILKRMMDIIISFWGLIFLGLLWPVLLIVRLATRKPIFYKQKRIGEDGKVFNIYKFRTMVVDAEKDTGPVFASKHDRRVTRIGRFLRKFNLDELPQLWNVFKGDMSLVGPRPERPEFVKKFKDDIPRYMSRHHVKSGMTGWAQVNGLRQNTPIKERVKYDLYYIENWSLWLDIKILLKTIFAIKNAY